MPTDIEGRELGTGKSRREVAMSLGLKPGFTAPRLGRGGWPGVGARPAGTVLVRRARL